MSDRNFIELLQARWAEGKFVCVGLDSASEKLPESVYRAAETAGAWGRQDAFNRRIIVATHGEICACKPNTAFYEADGASGVNNLQSSAMFIREHAPEVVLTVDGKRGDIGNTNDGYAKFLFDQLGADAITVPPYLGKESLMPFLDRGDRGVIVLCRTSNPGAGEFQDRPVKPYPDEAERWGITTDFMPFYQLVAWRVSREWNDNGNCALVVGATGESRELAKVRSIVGDMPILIPGVGAQGGDLEEAVYQGQSSNGTGMIINASRSVIFASSGEDFVDAAVAEVQRMNQVIRGVLTPAA